MGEKIVINGVEIAGGVEQSFVVEKTITLPSGKVAEIRKGRGRDLMKAQQMVQGGPDASNQLAVMYALIAVLTRLDGQMIALEDVLDLDIPDTIALQEAVNENFRPPAPPISQPSSNSDSGPTN